MRNIIATALVIGGVVLFLASIGANVYSYLQVKAVDGWLEQAQYAGTAEKMAAYCDLAIDEMDRLGMTSGYTVTIPIPVTPRFDMAVKYEVLQSIKERIEFVAQSTELNTIQQSQALIDLRGTLESFALQGTNWYLLNHGFPLKLAWLYGLQWLVMVVVGVFLPEED